MNDNKFPDSFISYDFAIKTPVYIINTLASSLMKRSKQLNIKEIAMYYVVKLFGGEFELNSKN
jgi:hypothetical protein